MSASVGSAGEILWVFGIVTWYVIRYPFERRAKRVRVVDSRRSPVDMIGLAAALLGQAFVPGFYVLTGKPKVADHPVHVWAIALGAILFFCGLWVFRRTHKELGKNWSITLQIRDKHQLVVTGPYALVRHPMYSSFLLLALGQAFLLSNWVAGLSGLAGFLVLFFLRVGKEEQMMLETFGSSYGDYMKMTKRIIPCLY
ncbi:protein-S-isoprenylcysteine O-methyltransferase [Sinorhizobium sp. BG8]|uniref:protein-S-isoprenylcysteine O-methyltransferase n=1 Tax=Sinorhizobium sp. BG8 TaxID=2613773 RepID=UPI00193E70E3|nr:protein-S-isoprenylcysteine O-methyltransferase [Sinorhizobium sp. BG8]QRM57208.1 isoprenylcysteine carboxylmethyltransferase family protein [Sinorhizobium sp. BG8]